MPQDPRVDPRQPKDWPLIRPPDRVMFMRVAPRRQLITGLVTYVPTIALAILLHILGLPDPLPILVALAVLAAIFLLSERGVMKSRDDQLVVDDARADEIALHFGNGLVLRRRFPFGWPLACALASAMFFLIGLQQGFPPPAVLVTTGLLLVTCIAIALALRNSGDFGRLTTDGIELGGRTFRWRQVRAIVPQHVMSWNWRNDSCWLRLSLSEPLTTEAMPRGGYWQFRRGATAHELLVSMKRTSEAPAVIYQLATQLMARDRTRVTER
jgi:hypothetical protein